VTGAIANCLHIPADSNEILPVRQETSDAFRQSGTPRAARRVKVHRRVWRWGSSQAEGRRRAQSGPTAYASIRQIRLVRNNVTGEVR